MNYIGVLIKLPNGATELIVNKKENFANKFEYYENAYSQDLKLILNEEIEILDFCCANNLYDIECDLWTE